MQKVTYKKKFMCGKFQGFGYNDLLQIPRSSDNSSPVSIDIFQSNNGFLFKHLADKWWASL